MIGLTAALDVGGTKIAGALLDGAGIAFRTEHPTPGPPAAADPGSVTLRLVADALARAAHARGDRVEAVGVGCCEYVHDGRLTSREVLAWTEQPAVWLAAVLPGARVVVESDVRCGLAAERVLGAARGVASAAFVSWGTGVSSALSLDDAIWPGARGRAIALGELPGPGGTTVERFCSGAGMLARWRAAGASSGSSARDLLDAADAGEPVAAEIARSAGRVLAQSLRSVVHLLDPEIIVLGGGLGSADTAARRETLLAWASLGDSIPLVPTEIGADGPLLGAALAAGWVGSPTGAVSGPGTGPR